MVATITPYYGLTKPDGSAIGDLISIAVLNTNMDLIDTAMHNHDTSITTLQGRATALETGNGVLAIGGSNAGSQNIPTGVTTALTVTNEIYDPQNSLVAPSAVITCKSTGYYQINIAISYSSNATGVRTMQLRRPSDNTVWMFKTTGRTGNDTLNLSEVIQLNNNDAIQVEFTQNSGVVVPVGLFFSMKKVA